MNNRLAFYCLILLLMTVACKKEKLPDAGGTKLDKIVVRDASGTQTGMTTYEYNSQGKLILVTSSNATSIISTDLYQYDSQGRLSKYTLETAPAGVVMFYTFQYDAANRIIRANGTPVLPTLEVESYAFTYDVQGRIVADTSFDIYGMSAYTAFGYDNRNNIVNSERLVRNTIGYVSQGVVTYQFDDKQNPYRFEGNPLYYKDPGSYEYLSVNNVLSHDPANGSIMPHYEYYSNGLLRTRSAPGLPYKMEFYYK